MCTKCETQNSGKSFINLNPFLPQKEVFIIDDFGQPVPFAEIMNLDNGNATITNNQGKATIVGYPGNRILISHVAFVDEQFTFENLPNTINMEGEYLDEVVVENNPKPKAASFMFFGVIALGIGAALYFNNKKGEGLKGSVPAVSPVPVTL